MEFRVVKDKKLIRRLSEYSADCEWISDNREDLTEKFPDFWVAIKNKTVWYTHEDFVTLLMLMVVRGDDPAQWAIEFMNTKPVHYILHSHGEMMTTEMPTYGELP